MRKSYMGSLNRPYYWDWSGNVGIGTTSPEYNLDVNGNVNVSGANAYYWRDGDVYAYSPAADKLSIMGGNVGIGTTSPQRTLEVNGRLFAGQAYNNKGDANDYNVISAPSTFTNSALAVRNDITTGFTNSVVEIGIIQSESPNFYLIRGFTGNGSDLAYTTNQFYVKGNGDAYFGGNLQAGSITFTGNGDIDLQGDDNHILGVEKLTVTTIDPVYEIDGVEYATYVSDYAGGVRVETSGTFQLKKKKDDVYFYVIDFDKLRKGGDIWLFWQASSKDIDSLVVILTPGFNGKVWYEKQGNKLIVYGNKSGEVSYRLTAPRKDYKDWPNLVALQKK